VNVNENPGTPNGVPGFQFVKDLPMIENGEITRGSLRGPAARLK
jgi:hypothetical protein